ncbi:MAG: glycosyltransferase family 2 protein [Nitrospirae bacterium]|nr:MAG: glycosyltransferase family 2 protein [Nitrospirota bacterium]
MSKLSLIIATLERADELHRLLSSLVLQTDKNFEVVIVDQSKGDSLVPMISEYSNLGLYIQHHKINQQNLSHARNYGARMAKGDILAFPDDDCWYEPDLIMEVRKAFFSKPQLDGIVAYWVEYQEKEKSFVDKRLSLDAWRKFHGGNASSITLFLKRRMLDSIGWFDERLGVGGWFGAAEETDLIMRALSAGAEIERCPTARVHHIYATTLSGNLIELCRKARMRAHGTGAVYAKHSLSFFVVLRGSIAPIILPIIRLAGFRALLCGVCITIGRIEGFFKWGWGKS